MLLCVSRVACCRARVRACLPACLVQALRYRGVHWANNMFVVTHFDKYGTKEWLTLGKFASADEAARCYDRHVRATDGTKAKLNFPENAQAPAGKAAGVC